MIRLTISDCIGEVALPFQSVLVTSFHRFHRILVTKIYRSVSILVTKLGFLLCVRLVVIILYHCKGRL